MNPASDYRRTFPARPRPLTLEQAARITPPVQVVDTEGLIDVPRMRAYRQSRLREQARALGLDALILVEPLSIRYRDRGAQLRPVPDACPVRVPVPRRHRPGDLLRQRSRPRDGGPTRDHRRGPGRPAAALVHVRGPSPGAMGAEVGGPGWRTSSASTAAGRRGSGSSVRGVDAQQALLDAGTRRRRCGASPCRGPSDQVAGRDPGHEPHPRGGRGTG